MNSRIPDTEQSEAPLPKMMLEEYFNECLCGHTVANNELPRFVYSLNKLAAAEKKRSFLVDDESARQRVWAMVQEITAKYGDKAPVFMDDAAFAEEKPKIWTPQGN